MPLLERHLKQIADATKANSKFAIVRQGIFDWHIEVLVNALNANENIKELDLSGNNISDEGAKVLATKLEHIGVLNLTWNNVGNEGAAALAELKQGEVLILARNNIGNEGAVALANSVIPRIDLSCNNVLDFPEELIAKIEQTEFDVSHNSLPEHIEKAIHQKAAENAAEKNEPELRQKLGQETKITSTFFSPKKEEKAGKEGEQGAATASFSTWLTNILPF